jgi:hypothetical protein
VTAVRSARLRSWARPFAGAIVVIALAAAGVSLVWRLGPAAAQPNVSFPVYVVNPGASSLDFDTCASPADTYGLSQPDWGESFLGGGSYYLNFTGQAEAHVAAIWALVPPDCAISVRIVPVSSAVGRALQSQIAGDEGSLNGAGGSVWGVAFDPISDRVIVWVSSLTPACRAAIERLYPALLLQIVEGNPPVPVAS